MEGGVGTQGAVGGGVVEGGVGTQGAVGGGVVEYTLRLGLVLRVQLGVEWWSIH